VPAHVGGKDRRLDDFAERRRLVAEVAKVAAEEVVEAVPPQHVGERHGVEVLEDRLVVVDLGDGRARIDLQRGESGSAGAGLLKRWERV